MPLFRPALVLILLLFSSAVLAADWRQMRTASERGDVSTWVKPVPGNPLNAFKGVIEVPHRMLTVLAVLGDIENFPSWVFQCHDTEMRLDEWGPDVARIKIRGIWPVSDRDAVARSTFTQDPDTLAVTIHSIADHSVLPDQPGYVRLPSLDNTFIVEPLESGWTRVTFQTFADPGGAIPSWLANLVATRAPLWTLQRMYREMQKPQYQISSVDELPMIFPGTENMKFR